MPVIICFPAFVCLDGRRGTFSPTAPHSSSAPGHFRFLLGPPPLHFDGKIAQSASAAVWSPWSRKFPHPRCALLWGKRCTPVFAQHRSPGPAGTCPESLQDGHFSETILENTQLHNCALASERRKSRGLRFHHKPRIIKCFNHTALLAG